MEGKISLLKLTCIVASMETMMAMARGEYYFSMAVCFDGYVSCDSIVISTERVVED